MSSIYSARYKLLLKKLVEARTKAGLTQAEVAKKIKKPQSFVSKIESGERRIEFTEIEDLSTIYRVPVSFFETQEIASNKE